MEKLVKTVESGEKQFNSLEFQTEKQANLTRFACFNRLISHFEFRNEGFVSEISAVKIGL